MKRLFAGLILVASFVYTIGCNLTPDRDRYYSGSTNNKGAENEELASWGTSNQDAVGRVQKVARARRSPSNS